MMSVFCRIMLLIAWGFVFFQAGLAQNANDLKRSVPLWFQYDEGDNKAVLKWMKDPAASAYNVGQVSYTANPTFMSLGTVTSGVDSFLVPDFEKGRTYHYRISKSTGAGFIDFGIEQPPVHQRGRCLILLEKRFVQDLSNEISTWMGDIRGDGWTVDTLWIDRSLTPVAVKQKIQTWYKPGYSLSQSLVLFGNIPVPYSGSTAIDGHPDHAGAWASDTYYADINGIWTDNSVDITTASRPENRNVPGDGKFDHVVIPSDVELETGRIDFSNVPAFSLSELELLRNYLTKNHRWRRGLNPYPDKALMENNFAGFDEGFGQNAWRNFLPMFGNGNVTEGDYESRLVNEKHLFTYACGGGSYTSCGGIGTTQNLWAAKSLQTVFTMTFGSYFGDWDSQNNFLRSALGSGDILVNMWAGRPNWILSSMASGAHIGVGTKLTQNANAGFFFSGNGARFTHVALMGDPTLRLHPLPSVTGLKAEEIDGIVKLSWDVPDTTIQMFAVYGNTDDEPVLLEIISETKQFEIPCLTNGHTYTFMVRPVKLTHTGSGSYYNLGTAEYISVTVDESNLPMPGYEHDTKFERVIFTNTSAQADRFEWDFGDGNRSEDAEPVHVYQQPGKYNVCLTAQNDICSEVIFCNEIEVESSLPSDVSAVFEEPACYGSADGGIRVFLTGGSEPDLSYQWDNGSIEKDLNNVVSGEYTLTVTSNISGKTLSSSFYLPQPDSLQVVVTTTPSTGQNGTVTLEVEGGVPPYSFGWNGQTDWMKLAPGTYSITVTDSNGCSKEVLAVVEMATATTDLQNNVLVTPNPVTDFISIPVNVDYNQIVITDVKGNTVRVQQDVPSKHGIRLDCTDLPSGSYFVLLSGTAKPVKVIPIVKQ